MITTKLLRTLSKVVLILFLLSVFAFSVRHIVLGGSFFGGATRYLTTFIEFPQTAIKTFSTIRGHQPDEIARDSAFQAVNHLQDDLFVLSGKRSKNHYVFHFSNLRTDSVIHEWNFAQDQYTGPSEKFGFAEPLNPIVMEDGSLIGLLHETKNLFRLDKASNLVWKNSELTFHHSINFSHDSFLWTSAYQNALTQNVDIKTRFVDDLLVKVDPNSGAVLWRKSLASILADNHLVNWVHGFGNGGAGEKQSNDLLHLNDIQPIIENGTYWKQGDLLLSLRHRSCILLYRPSTNQVLRIITGPFLSQHDVDIRGDGEITIFNNNRASSYGMHNPEINEVNGTPIFTFTSSNLVKYQFGDSTFSFPFKDIMERENIFTRWGGLHEFLNDSTVFIEATHAGKIYLLQNNRTVVRKYPNYNQQDQSAQLPNWIRVYRKNILLNTEYQP